MAMITCTSLRFDPDAVDPDVDGRECGKPATQRVTITGADRAKNLRPTSTPTPWNLDRAPRCDFCARMDRRVIVRLFPPDATFDSEPIESA